MQGSEARGVRVVWLAVAITVFAVAFHRAATVPAASSFHVGERSTRAPRVPGSLFDPLFEVGFASSGGTPSVHSATAIEIAGGDLRAFWYGGSREGATDVAIYSSVFDAETDTWRPEQQVTTREETQKDLARYIKKLGNPVVTRDRGGRLWLFYVSVSIGGWSGSAINARSSADDGRTWSRASRLVTSPFLNLSTLVKGPAIHYADGMLGLPVYHELLGKFGELARLDENARVIGKTRLSWGQSSLQPVVVPLDGERALALMRRSGRSAPRILATETSDAGRHWTAPRPTSVSNPDAAIAALRSQDGELLLAFNDSEHDRSHLTLALSNDRGQSWQSIHVLDPPAPVVAGGARFAYPWLVQGTNGEFHLLYTWNRERIVHVRFNREWLLHNR